MIRVLIASRVRLITDLIETVVKNQKDMQVAGYATTAEEAWRQRADSDVMVVSATLPNEEINELLRSAGATTGTPHIIIFGVPQAQPVLLHYLEAGAAGCISSEDSVEQLLHAIRAAARAQIVLSPHLAALVRDRVVELADKCSQLQSDDDLLTGGQTLTQREQQVLALIAQGYRNRDIAKHLTIELGTTKNHVHNILSKLRVNKRQDAVAYWALNQ